MSMTTPMTTAKAALLAATVVTATVVSAAAPAVAQAGPMGETAQVAAGGTGIVTTVEVPATPYPVQVSRAYSYELVGTCWSRTGRPLLDRQRVIARVSVPQSAGDSQLRLPDDARTTFRFADAAGMLAHPQSGTTALSCPKNTTAGVYRASLGAWTVRVLHYGGAETVLTGDSDVELHYPAPGATVRPARAAV